MITAAKRQQGRPPKPPEEVANVRISIGVTPSEAAEFKRRGGGPWVRRMLQETTNKQGE